MVVASTMPVFAQQDRGHGAIVLSSSFNRIGWARSLSSDGDAHRAAFAMCRGGQIDATSLQDFSDKHAGISATGPGPLVDTIASDCNLVIKFDSASNHQCGGFGFDSNQRHSNGAREDSESAVNADLSSWSQKFVVCNDDQAVSGAGNFFSALDKIARAFGGGRSRPVATPTAAPVAFTGSAITFQNDLPTQVTYYLKCTNEATYHTFTILGGSNARNDAATWGASCPSYDLQIPGAGTSGGGTAVVSKTLQAGGPYHFAFDARQSLLTVLDSSAGLGTTSDVTIVNDTPGPVIFMVTCPNLAPTSLSVAGNGTISHRMACDQGATLSVSTGTTGNSVAYAYPVSNGRIYHLRLDSNSLYTLVGGS